MLALGAYIFAQNARYLLGVQHHLGHASCAALGFIALGQTVALMTGGIDLSVGPLAGFLVVVGSFFLNDEKSADRRCWPGFVLMVVAAAVTGAVNGIASSGSRKFTPVAATLATYIALQGLSFLLRDAPGGNIAADVTDLITTQDRAVPVVFVVLVVVDVAMEYALRYSRLGPAAAGCRLRRGVRPPASVSTSTRTVVLGLRDRVAVRRSSARSSCSHSSASATRPRASATP